MVDLAITLEQFQDALTQRKISPKKSDAHEHLYVLHDDSGGLPRVTYARIVDGQAQALVAFFPLIPLTSFPVSTSVSPSPPPFGGGGLGRRS